MSRPRACAVQQLAALQLWRRGLTVRAIHARLGEAFGSEAAVSRGTVGNWVQGFSGYVPPEPDPDSPFEWTRIREFGVPAGVGSFLLQVASVHSHYGLEAAWHAIRSSGSQALSDPDGIGLRLSVREARWMWHVYQAVDGAVHLLPGPVPESLFSSHTRPMPWQQFEVISLSLARAEQGRDVLGQELDVSDIEHYLAYRPWSSDGALARYEEAISLVIVRAWARDAGDWRRVDAAGRAAGLGIVRAWPRDADDWRQVDAAGRAVA